MISSRRILRPCARSFASSSKIGTRNLKPAERDPNRPKRPKTSFFRFCDDMRPQLPPHLTSQQKTHLMGEKWRALSNSEKLPYQDKYAADLKRHQIAYDEYKISGRQTSWRRPPGMPKQPVTAFLHFSCEYRKQNLEVAKTYQAQEFQKATGAAWRSLQPHERKVFEDLYRVEKERYDHELEAFRSSGALESWKAKVGVVKIRADGKPLERNRRQPIEEHIKRYVEWIEARITNEEQRVAKVIQRCVEMQQQAVESAVRIQELADLLQGMRKHPPMKLSDLKPLPHLQLSKQKKRRGQS